MSKMPFRDAYGRDGKYTGEINNAGEPHGKGTLRYDNGILYEGTWEDGVSPKMEGSGERISSGFSDWKSMTKASKQQREKDAESELAELRSYVSMSVRSQSTSGMSPAGPGYVQNHQQYGGDPPAGAMASPHHHHPPTPTPQHQHQPRHRIANMPWADVNGFTGHYTGEVNGHNAPDGGGYMQYSNGVVEDGMWCNGVYQPPHEQPQTMMSPNGHHQQQGVASVAPPRSSAMSVWSLRTSPTAPITVGGQPYHHQGGYASGNASVMGGPTSVYVNHGGDF